MIFNRQIIPGLLIACVWLLPTIAGYQAQQHPDSIFLGWIRTDDFNRYGSFIEQTAREGRILYEDHSTTDAQSPRMIAIYFTFLGLLVYLLRIPSEVSWQLSYGIMAVITVIALHRFVKNLYSDSWMRIVAFYLVLCSSGFEWISLITDLKLPRPRNFWMDGFSTFTSFHNPLKIAGLILTLMMIENAAGIVQTDHWRKNALRLGGFILLIWMVHPNSAIVAYFAIGFLAFCPVNSEVTQSFRRLSGLVSIWKRLLWLVVPFALIAIYVMWMQTDPMTANIIRQYHVPHSSEPLWTYPFRYGFVLIFGLWGAVRAIRSGDVRDKLLVGWLIGGLLFSNYKGMTGLLFQHMIHFPLALLAVSPLFTCIRWTPIAIFRWMIPLVVFIPSITNDIYAIRLAITQTQNDVWPTSLYASQSDLDMIQFLSTLPKGNVLVNRDTGNKIGWLALHNVYLGHWGTTPEKGLKEKNLKRFYDPTTPYLFKQTLLDRYQIRYVWYGPRERQLGPLPETIPFRQIRTSGNVSLYEVGIGT